MSTLNLGGRSLATLYSSLWLCDAKGDVYVLKNLESYVDRYIARLQFDSYLIEEKTPHLQHLDVQPTYATPPPIPTSNWIKVGSGFSCIAAGFEGLVCGIKNSELYIRMGVSYYAPEGTSWAKIICEATQIAVGKDCIVRRTSLGNLYIANVREEYNNCTKNLVPNWTLINVYSLRQLLIEQHGKANELSLQAVINSEHLLLDERDRLFIVAPSGAVYGCLEPGSNDDNNAQWVLVSQAPRIDNLRPSFLRNLFSWLRGKNKESDGIFSQVCVGKSSLWCVRADNSELWQLVLCDFATSGGVSELRANWSAVPPIPAEEERTSQFAASKSTVDGIYAVMVKNSNGRGVIVAYSFNQAGNTRVNIKLPSLDNPTCLVVSLTLRSSVNNTVSANNMASASKVHRMDTDICCENGDCHFCRNVQRIIVPGMIQLSSPLNSRMEMEEQGTHSGILGKRPHPELADETVTETQVAVATSRGNASTSSVEEHRPKRRRSDRYPRLDTYDCLLEGVEVQRNPQYTINDYPNLPDPSVLLNPLPSQHIDTMYEYTFSLEDEVVYEDLGRLN